MSLFKKYLEIIQEGLIQMSDLKNTKGVVVLFYDSKTYSSDEPIEKGDTIRDALNKFSSSIGVDTLEIYDLDTLMVQAAKENKLDENGNPDPYQLNFAKNYSKIEVIGSKGIGIFQFLK